MRDNLITKLAIELMMIVDHTMANLEKLAQSNLLLKKISFSAND